MTVGDFANADPAPAPLYAREVKATTAEAGLPAEAERRFPVRIRIGIAGQLYCRLPRTPSLQG